MSLENLTGNKYINALVPSNPTASDDRYEGDNHLRGIKNVLVKSFPQITGPVQVNQTELSGMQGYVGPSNVETRLAATEAHVAQSNIHFADVTGDGITYGRTTAGWVPVSGGGQATLGLLTGGDTNTIALNCYILRDAQSGDNVVNNEVMSFVVVGSSPGATIHVGIAGSTLTTPIAIVGNNGMAHGWLFSAGVVGYMSSIDASWAADNYVKTVSVELFEQAGAGYTLIPPSKVLQITKKTL